MELLKHLLSLSMVVFVRGVEDKSRLVNIEQGPVNGYKVPGWDLFEFSGIPYASAPTGKDRFKAPLDPPSWVEPFEAVQRNIVCPQGYNSIQNVANADLREDCLIASLYVPDTNRTDIPVLVFAHGGAFQNGFADRSSARNLVQSKDIIVAMFNYRIGAHGFLCLGTANAPGNAGMKDQVAFLRWVQKNIAYFGGDPSQVTIYGSSAGGRSVDLLMMSKITEGLFKNMIADSGVTLGASTVQVDPLGNARTFARMLGFHDNGDIGALEQFYLDASYETLTSIETTRLNDFLFSPCVERDLCGEVFLDENPYSMLQKGNYRKVPLLYGFTELDGTFRLGVFDDWKDAMNEDITDFLPHDLQFPSEEERNDVVKLVRSYYFGDEEINNQNILLYINYFTDTMYVYPMLRAVKMHLEADHSGVYLYEYSFTSEESSVLPHINKAGAFHSVQTQVILDYGDETSISEEFKKMKIIMRDMWYNFIQNGHPVLNDSSYPAWSATQRNNLVLMSLNQTIEMKPLEHRALFWDSIYEQYYKEPIPPNPDGYSSSGWAPGRQYVAAYTMIIVYLFSK